MMALKPLEWWTSEKIESDCDRVSKIRARQCLRLDETDTTSMARWRASQTREQEVVLRFPTHKPRLDPA